MTNEEAMHAIDDIMIHFPENSKVAEALFKAKIELSQKTTYPYIQCKKCGYWYMRTIEEQIYDENDIIEYYCYCPHCGEEYNWNEYY